MEKKHQYQLVGACIVLALAVIFLPMLLDGTTQADNTIVTKPMPIPPVHKFSTLPPVAEFDAPENAVVLNASQDAEPSDGGFVPLEPVAGEPVKTTADDTNSPADVAMAEVTQQVADPAIDKVVVPAPDMASSGSEDLSAWAVQVASFGDKDKALALRDQLRAKQHVTFVEELSIDGKSMYRVKIGPLLKKPEAQKVQQVIAKAFALSGIVIPYP